MKHDLKNSLFMYSVIAAMFLLLLFRVTGSTTKKYELTTICPNDKFEFKKENKI